MRPTPSVPEAVAILRDALTIHMGIHPLRLVVECADDQQIRLRMSGLTLTPAGPAPQRPATEPIANPTQPGTRHTEDFRSVCWMDTDYAFTPTQAAVVRQLWEARENGTPNVGQAALLETANSDARRLRDLFRESGGQEMGGQHMHPAWGTLIVPGTGHGMFRLADDQEA